MRAVAKAVVIERRDLDHATSPCDARSNLTTVRISE
jgi:hypothetical protein